MPYLKLQTNQTLIPQQRQAILTKISSTIASELGKPEAYVMTALEVVNDMTLGGTFDPLAFVELKSIGLPTQITANLSSVICDLIESELKIPASRVYIEFKDVPRQLWGYNRTTF